MINCIVEDIIKIFNVNKFIETGVFMGDTMMIVQNIFCKIYGDEFNTGPWNQGVRGRYRMYEIENNVTYFEQFIKPKHQKQINVEIVCEDSVKWLREAINRNEFIESDICLFYLDAHSHQSPNSEPLRDEISQILRLKNKLIICIDDWYVPGKNLDIYSLNNIKDLIKDKVNSVFYTDKHNFHGKWSVILFINYENEIIYPLLVDLPIIEEKI